MKVKDLLKICDNVDRYTSINFYDNEPDYQLRAVSFKRDCSDLTFNELNLRVVKFYVYDDSIDIFVKI